MKIRLGYQEIDENANLYNFYFVGLPLCEEPNKSTSITWEPKFEKDRTTNQIEYRLQKLIETLVFSSTKQVKR